MLLVVVQIVFRKAVDKMPRKKVIKTAAPPSSSAEHLQPPIADKPSRRTSSRGGDKAVANPAGLAADKLSVPIKLREDREGAGSVDVKRKKKRRVVATPVLAGEREVSKYGRRLDSFARLLELGGVCAAVCLIDNNLVVTSNMVYITESTRHVTDNITTRDLIKVLQYFHKAAQKESPPRDEALTILTLICRKKIISSLKGVDPQYEEFIGSDTFKTIVTELFDSRASGSWLRLDPTELATKHLSAADRAIHDKRSESSTAKKELKRISKMMTIIQRAYFDCDRLIDDFKKTIAMFDKGSSDINFQLIACGEKGEHAEMRMIGYLLDEGLLDQPRYIGISKLCCADCESEIGFVNQKLLEHTGEAEAVNIESDDESAHSCADESVTTRGGHGLAFKSTKRAGYLESNDGNSPYLTGAQHYDATGDSATWKKISVKRPTRKEKALKAALHDYRLTAPREGQSGKHTSMYAATSSSSDEADRVAGPDDELMADVLTTRLATKPAKGGSAAAAAAGLFQPAPATAHRGKKGVGRKEKKPTGKKVVSTQ